MQLSADTGIAIDRFEPDDTNAVIDVILAIQRGEFGFSITADDQPDLRAIPDFYQTGTGDFWVARKDGKVVGTDDFDAQCVQTFANIEAALKSVGAGWGNIVQFTTYLVHSQDIPKFMKYRLREFPKMFSNGVYPPNTLLMVDRLVQEPLLVEVQAVAAL